MDIRKVHDFEISVFEKGKIYKLWLEIAEDGIGMPICIPIILIRGNHEGPTLGVTAVVHGNELNGIPVIQRLVDDLNPETMFGNLLAVPVVNVPGYLMIQRAFNDNQDLNRLMPGKKNGNSSELYSWRIVHKLLNKVNFLIDLHTASFGRVNSYYVRSNLQDPFTKKLAKLANAQIILDNSAPDSTVRGTMMDMGIKSITLEVGDPNKFQKSLIRSGIEGLNNALVYLGLIKGEIIKPSEKPVICKNSYWLYTNRGGVLNVIPQVTDKVKKGEKIAILRDIFGDLLQEYFAPEAGIVIGKSVHPVAQSGARILHLGIIR